MTYKVSIGRKSSKFLKTLEKQDSRRIIEAIERLKETPRPHGCVKLEGRPAWRIRVGQFRIVYSIRDDELIVLITNIGHRRDVYR